MNNFMLFIAGLLVAVLTALFAVPPLINWNDFRGVFEEEASRLLDREVRVRGAVSVRFLPVPYVSFEQVRIADAPGVPGSFARAEQFKMWLSVPPLLRGVIEARQIELEKPVIRLRTEADGTGNWRKLQISKRDLAYIPSEVALNSVRISNGTLLFESHHGHEISRLDKISGELIAGSLTGPYKFIGSVPLGGSPASPDYEVRVSTARMEDNGEVRFSGSVRSPDNRVSHSVNGTLFDLLGNARGTGVLISRRQPPKTREAASSTGTDASPGADASLGAGYEMSADVKLDTTALKVDKIEIAFRNNNRQHTIKGEAVTSWREELVTETKLTAGWLDLDAIAGTRPNDRPMRIIERLLTGGVEPFGVGVTSVDLKIDQANLAGTSVSGLSGRMVRRDGITKIESLRASLPGRSSLSVDGFLERGKAGMQFDGNALLQSASLAELVKWLRLGMDDEALAALTSAFSISGNIRVRPESVDLSDTVVTLADATVEGALNYNWSGRPLLAAAIDTDRLSLARFGQDVLAPAHIARLLGFADPANAAKLSGKPTSWLHGVVNSTDMAITLRARSLSDSSRTFSNVDLDIARTGDVLRIGSFKANWEPGLALALSGQLSNISTTPVGNVQGTISASDEQAADHLVELGGLAAGIGLPARLFAGRTPFRMSLDLDLAPGNTAPGNSAAGNVDKAPASRLVADGAIGADRVRVVAVTHGQAAGWRRQPSQIEARIDGRDAFDTIQWLVGAPLGATGAHELPRAVMATAEGVPTKGTTAATEAGSASAAPATVVVSAVGVPAEKLKAFMRIDAGAALDADFSGELRLSENNEVLAADWAGELDIRQATKSTLAKFMWPDWVGRFDDAAARGRVAVSSSAAGYKMRPQNFEWGQTRLDGELILGHAASGEPAPITGTLSMNAANLPALAQLLMSGATPTVTGAAPAAEALPGDPASTDAATVRWPDTPFDLTPFAHAKAEVAVKIATLALNDNGSRIKDAVFTVASGPGGVTIRDFSGGYGNSAINGQLNLEASQVGPRLTAALSAEQLKLGDWAPAVANSGRLAGTADLSIKLSGQALSPRSLASLLTGSGEVKLVGVVVPGMTSKQLTDEAGKVIDGELELEALSGQLADLASAGSVAVGTRTLKLNVANGVVALPTIQLERPGNGLRNATFVDLATWRLDSQWTITPAPQPRPSVPNETVPLPPVALIFTGPLATVDQIEPTLELGDLERELVVRKMEANVARLEQLRREDEARAEAERERQRRIEEEQQRSLEEERQRRLQPVLPRQSDNVAGPIIRAPQPARPLEPKQQ